MIDVPPDLTVLLELLAQRGGRPVMVGGAVRDALLGRGAVDVDIECYALDYGELVEALCDHGRVDTTGEAFGVVHFQSDELDLDVSLPRIDRRSGPAHRGVEVVIDHTMSFAAASARRDFTVNAMGWDPFDGRLLDPHGGERDLEAGTLRHVSAAFVDDPLRVLRGVQLAGRLDMQLATETVALCRRMSHEYPTLSRERIWDEWEKIGRCASRPSRSLAELRRCGWLVHLPDLVAIEGIPQDLTWHPEGAVEVHTAESMDAAARWCADRSVDGDARLVAVFGAMVHDLGKATHTQIHPGGRVTAHGHAAAGVEPARRLLDSIGAPRWLVEVVLPIIREHMCVACAPEQVTPAAVRRLARRLAPATMVQWASVVEADHLGRGTASKAGITDRWMHLAHEHAVERQPAGPFLRGEMLTALGLRPGPQFRSIIDASMAAQDEGTIHDAASAVEWAAQHLEHTQRSM